MGVHPVNDTDGARRRGAARRTAVALAVVATVFYLGIVLMMLNHS